MYSLGRLETTVLYAVLSCPFQTDEVMPNIYYCHSISQRSGMLRAVLSDEETRSLLKLQSAHYVGLQFPTMTPDQKVDFVVLRIFAGELAEEWQAGFYCFEGDLVGIEESIQTCTAKLTPIGAN